MIEPAVIERYETYVRALSQGRESVLAVLAGHTDPESLRRRAGALLDLGRNADARALLEERPLDLEWSEQLLRAQVRSKQLEAALRTIEWTRDNGSAIQAARAALIASVEAMEISPRRLANFNELPVVDLAAPDRETFEFARDLVTPLAREISDTRTAQNTLERLLIVTALRVAAVLGDMSTLQDFALRAERVQPFPLELAHFANAGLIEPKDDWSKRIRQDHKSVEAYIVSAVLETRYFGRARGAFERLLGQVDSTRNSVDSQNLYFGLREISQYLGGAERRTVDDLASRLLADSRELLAFANAETALSAGQTSIADKLLDDWKDPSSPVWVQLTAQLLMQKRELSQAIELLEQFSSEHASPATLHLLAQAAFRAERYDVARTTLEKVLAMRPADINSRRNLGLVLLRLNDTIGALPILKSLVEHNPDNEADLLLYAQSLRDVDQTETAISELSRFLILRPASLPARILLASALQAAGRQEEAFKSLQQSESDYKDEPHFQFALFEAASRAGHDLDAHNAMQALIRLQEVGKVSEKALWRAPISEVVEYAKSVHEKLKNAHLEYLQGKLPWLALAELEHNPVLWAWFLRTQKMSWLAEHAQGIAQYSIYSTNSFTVLRDETGNRLVDIEAAPFGSTIALDISALVTIWECKLLEQLCASYERILVPSLYLERAMADRPRLLPHQLSQRTTVQEIQSALQAKRIFTSTDTHATDDQQLSEYSDTALWRLNNVKDALRNAGLLNQDASERLSRISHRPPVPAVLQRHTELLVELHTLRTLTSEGLLALLADNWRVLVTPEARDEVSSSVRAFEAQDKIFDSHDQLWREVRSRPNITLVPTRGTLSGDATESAPRTPFLGVTLAVESQVPLLVDDRFSQQIVLNARGTSPCAAFGSDQWLIALVIDKRISGSVAANAFLDLMERRYKFFVPPSEILLAIVDQYPDVVPNHGLRVLARYLHASMRDPGLYAAAEPVVPPVSVGLRLYSRWTMELAYLAAAVWGTSKYSEQYAESMTKWIVREALPSPAQTMGSVPNTQLTWGSRQHFLKYFSTASLAFRDNERMSRAFSVVREALQFTDTEYVDCLIEVISNVNA